MYVIFHLLTIWTSSVFPLRWMFTWLWEAKSSKALCLIFQGDFLVHFMDIAREELTKKPEDISVEKLQVFSLCISHLHEKVINFFFLVQWWTTGWNLELITEFFYYDKQSLLDLALRTTAAAADPCSEDLRCCVVSNYSHGFLGIETFPETSP